MNCIINDLKPLIQEAIYHGDLSPNDDCVKSPDNYKAYIFLGFSKAQLFCVVFRNEFEPCISKLFTDSYEALQEVRASNGKNIKAQRKLSMIEKKIMVIIKMLPVIELGACKTFGSSLNLPMLYSY
jgi:hypothetical protein